jgi:hypothetical protein
MTHPLLELFNTPGNGSLSGTQIFQYRQLTPGPDDRVLARYDDGAAALVERRMGAGRALVLTTTLDSYWNTLALQRVFVPFIHRLMNYLAAYQPTPAWFTVGDVVDVARHTHTLLGSSPIAPDEDLIVEIPSGEQRRLTGENKLLTLSEQGFYEVHRTNDAAAKAIIATNIDSDESDFNTFDVAAVVETINATAGQMEAAGAAADSDAAAGSRDERSVLEQEQHQRLWWYLLLMALVVLTVETLLSNRLSGKAQQL